MARHQLLLEPLDTLFFRDSRPFNQDDEGLAEARSMMPPFPTVTAGAVRAALARTTGWHEGLGTWEDHMVAEPGSDSVLGRLGDGAFDPGQLAFGPTLIARLFRDGSALSPQLLLPFPYAVLLRRGAGAGGTGGEMQLARPSSHDAEPITDLGPDGDGTVMIEGDALHDYRPAADCWLSTDAMARLLAGELPHRSEVRDGRCLFTPQRRVGLERDYRHHIAVEARLYTAAHIRLADDYALAVTVEAPDEASLERLRGGCIPLGGHGRMAEASLVPEPGGCAKEEGWRPGSITPPAEAFRRSGDRLRYHVSLLSPALLPVDRGEEPQDHGLDDLCGKMVGACHDRPVRFAGWDRAARRAAANRRWYRAGSTWFFEVELGRGGPDPVLDRLRAIQERGLGRFTRVGFGAFVIGTWPAS